MINEINERRYPRTAATVDQLLDRYLPCRGPAPRRSERPVRRARRLARADPRPGPAAGGPHQHREDARVPRPRPARAHAVLATGEHRRPPRSRAAAVPASVERTYASRLSRLVLLLAGEPDRIRLRLHERPTSASSTWSGRWNPSGGISNPCWLLPPIAPACGSGNDCQVRCGRGGVRPFTALGARRVTEGRGGGRSEEGWATVAADQNRSAMPTAPGSGWPFARSPT
jgi:hypothetical protein